MIILDYYRIFYYVAHYKSFTKAAAFLNNSQPNITRCMNILENELGCQLFIRSNRGVSLTPEGETLFHYVSVGYEQILAGEEKIKREKDMKEGGITIGTSEIALHLFLLEKLELFHEKYPHIHLHIMNTSAPQAIDALLHHLVDFSLVASPLNIRKPLTKTTLYSFQDILIGGPKYASLAEETHHLSEVAHLLFISLGKDTSTRQLQHLFFLQHNLSFHAEMEAATTDQILLLIQHNLGVGFYPEKLTAPGIQDKSIVSIPLYESIPKRDICLLQNSSHSLSIAARTFIELLTQKN